jgi:hypothetical protein
LSSGFTFPVRDEAYLVSAPASPPTIADSTRALKDAAVASLRVRGLVVRGEEGQEDAEHDAMPYVTLFAREECGCGLSIDHHEFILSMHVCGLGRKPREIMRLADDAERAALSVGTHLAEWQILLISVERTRILRQTGGEWTGCLSFRALLTRKD